MPSRKADDDLQSLVMPQDEAAHRQYSERELRELEATKNNFFSCQQEVTRKFELSHAHVFKGNDPDLVKQITVNCYNEVLRDVIKVMPYSDAIAMLTKATQELSAKDADPQDVRQDIDFYGQVERLSQKFIDEVRYVEVQKYQ